MDDPLAAPVATATATVHDATSCNGEAKLAESCNANGTSAVHLATARHDPTVSVHDDAAVTLPAGFVSLAELSETAELRPRDPNDNDASRGTASPAVPANVRRVDEHDAASRHVAAHDDTYADG